MLGRLGLEPILAPISWGDLLDKITILEIKAFKLTNARQLANVRSELEALILVRDQHSPDMSASAPLIAELKAANEALWQMEDEIRDCERLQEFGPRFLGIARAIYRTNDRRAALKRRLNESFGSTLVEEKSYQDY